MNHRAIGHKALLRGLLALTSFTVAACSGATTPTSAVAPSTGPTVAAATSTAAATPVVTAPANATKITFWSWVPDIDKQVAKFNATHSDVFVNYVNNGNGNTEYAKLKTALQAGTDVPDVVQIEYQHLPGFIARGNLANLANYGAASVKDNFVPWTWAQVSQGSGVYAYPQDAGPMILMCNQDVLTKAGISAPPKTWDEYKADAAAIHKADSSVYLDNFTDDQGWFFGLLWQAGVKPFAVDGANISINFTSDAAMKVANFWGDMLKSGNTSPIGTWSNDWNSALAKGKVACWEAGAWGPESIIPNAADTAGKWVLTTLPQWDAAHPSNGNYGGSSIAVTSSSQNQKAADEFARWLTADKGPTLELTGGKAQLFPVQSAVTSDATWSGAKDTFFGGQTTHQTMVTAMGQVDPSFKWGPFTDYVYSVYATDLVNVHSGKMAFADLMKDLQTKAVQYAKDQGFTVK